MKQITRYQVRGIPGNVERVEFDGRIVDYWSPNSTTSHLLIAHDGQNVFDRKTATHHQTWRMAQSALRVSKQLGVAAPAIIAIFHSRTPLNPWGRIIDLAPQDPFQNGLTLPLSATKTVTSDELLGNKYLESITDLIVPTIATEIGIDLSITNKAIIGSSLGALASLYALSKRPDFFTTSLALSPHWTAGEDALVDALIDALPKPGLHKIWMSYGSRGHDVEYGPFQRRAELRMIDAGWQKGKDFASQRYPRSGHNERSWARYLDQPMKFWLQK